MAPTVLEPGRRVHPACPPALALLALFALASAPGRALAAEAPATGVVVTPSVTSPAPAGTAVTFTAQGIGGTGTYLYQFYFKTMPDGAYAIVQPYSTNASWTMPAGTPAGDYRVLVYVKTNAAVFKDAQGGVNFTLNPPKATGVTVTASAPSPQPASAGVTFTAQGQGSSDYQYRFYWKLLSDPSYSIVQDYGAKDTWTIPSNTPPGNYRVMVYVRTATSGAQDAMVGMNYTVRPAPATGLTVTASAPSPQPASAGVTFTAQGQGSSGYQYRFYWKLLTEPSYSIVQDYSANNTWTIPANTPPGQYRVLVYVRTGSTGPQDQQAGMNYTVRGDPATGLTVTASAPSPQAQGVPVTFTAAATGGSGTYQYKFHFKPLSASAYTVVQDWSAASSWQMTPNLPPGDYRVLVYVRTATTGSYDVMAGRNFTVTPAPPPAPPAVTSFTATPRWIVAGESVTLRVTYENGVSAHIVGVGAIASGGKLTVTPSADTTYTVEVTNSAGEVATASLEVLVFPTPLEPDYALLSPLDPSFDLAAKLRDPAHGDLSYWAARPPLAATLEYARVPALTAAERDMVAHDHDGWYRPMSWYPWVQTGLPPPWTDSPEFDRSYTFNTHTLTWSVPLVEHWVVDGDAASLELFKSVVASWVAANSALPAASKEAWSNHAVSYRMRLFCWFWVFWGPHAETDPAFSRLLLGSAYQHATYLAALEDYAANSNHGLHMDGSLLAAALTFPEFREAERWRFVAEKRLSEYPRANFSAFGFHLEQSPYYHWYVLAEMGHAAAFLRQNGEVPPALVDAVLDRGMRLWPYLYRPDMRIPNVGDSAANKVPTTWRNTGAAFLGRPVPPAVPSNWPSPRPGAGEFLLDMESGYAIFTSYPIEQPAADDDTYVIARANSRPIAGHAHPDALSFELFALGRDWLVDSGKLSYEESKPDRKYMRSSRAHNVVLVDDEPHGFGAVQLLDARRTADGDTLTVAHALPRAVHTRTFDFAEPREFRITDVLESADGAPHVYAQHFHVAPGLAVAISGQDVVLAAPDGATCTIRQLGAAGEWSAVAGQEDPYFLGWYSTTHGVRVPITTLRYTSPPEGAATWSFETVIEIAP